MDLDTRVAELLRRLVLVVSEVCAEGCDSRGIGNESTSVQDRAVADPHPVPPWEWRKRKSVSRQTLFHGVAALGFSLRSFQRDPNGWPK